MNGRTEGEQQGAGQLGQQTREAAEHVKSGAAEMAQRTKEAAGRLKESLGTARVRVQEGTVAGARATDRAIRDYPYQSLGIAFGLGLMVGVLIARR